MICIPVLPIAIYSGISLLIGAGFVIHICLETEPFPWLQFPLAVVLAAFIWPALLVLLVADLVTGLRG